MIGSWPGGQTKADLSPSPAPISERDLQINAFLAIISVNLPSSEADFCVSRGEIYIQKAPEGELL